MDSLKGLALFVAVVVAVAQELEPVDDTIVNQSDDAKYTDCDDLMTRGMYKTEGAYHVYLNSSDPVVVYCRFEDGVAYTPIMQQKYGRVSFQRSYSSYKNGFGSTSLGDFWIGLAKIYQLTHLRYNVLTVTLQDCTHAIKQLRYNTFHVGPESDGYRLYVGGYASSHILPDDFSHNSGMRFATGDKPDVHNCALHQKGGWWYNYCSFTLPTGKYYPNCFYKPYGGFYDGIYYNDWHGYGYSLKYIKLEVSRT